MRYPENANAFADVTDKVARDLEKQGRSNWLIEKRNEYDAAILNHDAQVVKTLELTQQALSETQRGAWIFVSDHGARGRPFPQSRWT